MKEKRTAKISRKTNETDITVKLNLDGTGKYDIDTPIPFLTHMLELLSKHSLIDISIKATGDIEIDYHHTVEDLGLTLGECLKKAIKDAKGINRFGCFTAPMDESLTQTSIDLSGRPFLNYELKTRYKKVGKLPVFLMEEFFGAFVQKANITLHIRLLTGREPHHIFESVFKSLAKTLKQAVNHDPQQKGIPSTKGTL